jgi:hypothetical protein
MRYFGYFFGLAIKNEAYFFFMQDLRQICMLEMVYAIIRVCCWLLPVLQTVPVPAYNFFEQANH